jgi:RNA methyltransferase, TrmH family
MALTKARLKELRELSLRKFRDERKLFTIEGVRLVQEAVDSDFTVLDAFHTADVQDQPAGRALLGRLKHRGVPLHQTTAKEMEAVSETVTGQGILAVVRQKEFSPDAVFADHGAASLIVAFDSVSDPGNLGTMIRTCDWFGVNAILLGAHSVELFNPKVVRSTMGGVFHLPIAVDVDLLPTISRARSMGYRTYVTDLKGEHHFDRVQYHHRSLIVFGNEAWGVSDQVKELADVRLSIRRYGAAESLNVSVACGVVLSAVHRLLD